MNNCQRGSSIKTLIISFPEMSDRLQQFSCCCLSVLYQCVLTQLSQPPTSCNSEQRGYRLHPVLFQFSCMTPKKVESASIETRAWGLFGITSSSSSSWCSCTIPAVWHVLAGVASGISCRQRNSSVDVVSGELQLRII